ncbi:LytTR family transcriptional regulator DNA-binding domain-containing protein [Rhodoplanes azumiensis]|uniref:LytTR family transcriptional regulator DNA-binding domain-containing protein n=1 Tax=Rhodoplanes azumiensis TaxID=1897628 RepID=A0ABW5AID2_9BRAD
MFQVLPDRETRSRANDLNLAKSMADASYQVVINAADITGHVEDITNRIVEQTELLGAVASSIKDMTEINTRIATSAHELLVGANIVTDRMSEVQAAATRSIGEAIGLIEDTATIVDRLPAIKGALDEIARAVDGFGEVARLRDRVVRRAASIAESTARNREHCEEILEDVAQLNDAELETKEDSKNVSNQCLQLSDLGAELYYTILASGVETADTPFIEVVIETAKTISAALEEALDDDEIDLETLFDEDYVQMPDIEPPKYTTRWLPLIEKLIPPICEPLSTMAPDVVLCTITDRNAYMPVNNLKFSHPPTNDPAWNATHSRYRIRHRDRISARIARSTKPFLVTVFRRRLGDRTQILKDVSSPIFIKGRLWGNVRMLILIKVENVDYILKQMDIHRAVEKMRGGDAAGIGKRTLDHGTERPEQRRDYPKKFCFHHAGRLKVIDNQDIQLFFAKDRLVFVQTEDGRQHSIRSTLSELEEKLDGSQFMRCHRNYIVNMNKIEYLTNWFNRGYLLTLRSTTKTEIPVSRVFVKHLKKYFEFD